MSEQLIADEKLRARPIGKMEGDFAFVQTPRGGQRKYFLSMSLDSAGPYWEWTLTEDRQGLAD